ncbi:MAG TPA: universal stress protein [Usitatibacter sp.]|nr:universal stress protein [Usitatibacter sp.]
MYGKILVPVDGSAASARGLREAIRLAKDQRARIRVVHVVDESMAIGFAESGVDLEPMLEGLVAKGKRILRRASAAARKAGVRAESQLYESMAGSAAMTILRDARKWRPALIVMGTHGRRGIRRVVLGSDAEHVLREATVPVLLVRGR